MNFRLEQAEPIEPDEDPDRERRLVRARIVAALGLAAAGLPLLSYGVSVARSHGLPALGGVGGGWLALALVIYLPLYFLGARWPLRCSLGSSIWASGALAWGLADLGQTTLQIGVWQGFVPLSGFLVPGLGALLYRWTAANRGFEFAGLPGGCAVGLVFGIGFIMLAGLVLGLLVMILDSAGHLPQSSREVVPRVLACAGLLGLQIGVSFGLSKETPTT